MLCNAWRLRSEDKALSYVMFNSPPLDAVLLTSFLLL
jgi:hypothetical protein